MMLMGLPLSIRKMMDEVLDEVLLRKRDCQFSGWRLPSRAMASISPARANVAGANRDLLVVFCLPFRC